MRNLLLLMGMLSMLFSFTILGASEKTAEKRTPCGKKIEKIVNKDSQKSNCGCNKAKKANCDKAKKSDCGCNKVKKADCSKAKKSDCGCNKAQKVTQ